MTDLQHIKLANQLPLNRAAQQFLPKAWRGNHTEMYALSLMRWGLENGISINPVSPDLSTRDQVEDRINILSQMNPTKVMQFLIDPESTGDVILSAEDLLKQENSLDAASLLLESLCDAMAATAP